MLIFITIIVISWMLFVQDSNNIQLPISEEKFSIDISIC